MEPSTDTQIIQKSDESTVRNMSIRAIITIIIVCCVCAVCTYGAIESKDFEVHEPMYSLVMLTVGFFFGQKTTK